MRFTGQKHPARSALAESTAPIRCATPSTRMTASFPGVKPPKNGGSFYGSRDWLAGGLCVDRLRLSRRAYSLRMAVDQLAVRHRGHVRISQGQLFLLQGLVGKRPVVHVFPHWNWEGREGDEIPVWVYSNLDEVELFVNGKSLGSQKVPHLGHVQWKVRYEPGVIEARGSKDGKVVLTGKRETTGPAAALRLSADRTEISADGEDLVVIKVEGLDKEGRLAPIAGNLIGFKVTGNGVLIGVGNGDPNCQESDKAPRRSLFNGLAQVIVQSTKQPGEIQIEAHKDGWEGANLTPATITIKTKQVELRPAVG